MGQLLQRTRSDDASSAAPPPPKGLSPQSKATAHSAQVAQAPPARKPTLRRSGAASRLSAVVVHQFASEGNVGALGRALQAHPDLAAQPSEAGDLPIHSCARSAHPAAHLAMEALLAAYPDAAIARDAAGRLPLHVMAASGCSIASVVPLIRGAPHVLGLRGGPQGNLPLHEAAKHASPLMASALLQLFYAAYPAAVAETNYRGDYPLHLAAATQIWPLVERVALWYAPALMAADASGRLPLHVVLQDNRSQQIAAVVAGLLRLEPAAAAVRTASGQLPLHLACLHCESPRLLRLVLQANPEAIKAPLWSQLPLHLVAEHGGDAEAPRRAAILQRSYPQAGKCYDDNKNLPLHLCRSPNLAKMLAYNDPETATVVLKQTSGDACRQLEHAGVLMESVARVKVSWASGHMRLSELADAAFRW